VLVFPKRPHRYFNVRAGGWLELVFVEGGGVPKRPPPLGCWLLVVAFVLPKRPPLGCCCWVWCWYSYFQQTSPTWLLLLVFRVSGTTHHPDSVP